jgi:hypothetical protein
MANGVLCRCATQNEQYYTLCQNARICVLDLHGACMNHAVDADDIIRRMRQVFSAKNDSELADALGFSVSAPSNWRQRNSPPFAICAEIACENGVSLDWLIFGIGEMPLGARGDTLGPEDEKGGPHAEDHAAQRVSRFVNWWYLNRTRDEMIWLEQQFKRAVPEYGEWLAIPPPSQASS